MTIIAEKTHEAATAASLKILDQKVQENIRGKKNRAEEYLKTSSKLKRDRVHMSDKAKNLFRGILSRKEKKNVQAQQRLKKDRARMSDKAKNLFKETLSTKTKKSLQTNERLKKDRADMSEKARKLFKKNLSAEKKSQ
jgi:hypothetical protein